MLGINGKLDSNFCRFIRIESELHLYWLPALLGEISLPLHEFLYGDIEAEKPSGA